MSTSMPGRASWWRSPRKVAWRGAMKGTFWFLMTLRDAKVIRFEIYGGRDQALEAAGLRE
jgi:hypothetical protein